ncbi:MAG: hypothetical protein AAB907_01265 [Patescibacteria group bacterium]
MSEQEPSRLSRPSRPSAEATLVQLAVSGALNPTAARGESPFVKQAGMSEVVARITAGITAPQQLIGENA